MKHGVKILVFALFSMILFSGSREREEGMWLLDSIQKLPIATMEQHGLQLTPEQIYNPAGPSLTDAVVLLGGGTASFISSEGLMVTNHHVAYGGITEMSSVQDDYLKNGFWAKTSGDEQSTTYTAEIVVGMKDVSAEILSAVNDTMPPQVRANAVQARLRQVEDSAKAGPGYACRVNAMFDGMKYYLFTYLVLSDIRLVYAPPSAIGNYGGEVDNWIWPRHTGDFSLMRAYVGPDGKPAKYSKNNIPYTPRAFLPISTQGYREGSFAMVLGFPGRTFRYREAASVQVSRDETMPTTIDLFKTRMDIMENAGKNNRALEIQYASRLRRLANTYKNYIATLEGMRRTNLLVSKRKEEASFAAWVNSRPELAQKYGRLPGDMQKANDELTTFNRKSIVLSNVSLGVELIRLANRFRTFAAFPRDAGGKAVSPPEKELSAMREFIASVFKSYDRGVDEETLRALIMKSLEMPRDQQPEAFSEIAGDRTGKDREERVREFVHDLYHDSFLATPEGCEKMLQKDPESIMDDDYITFASKLAGEQLMVSQLRTKYTDEIGGLRLKFATAWLAWKDGQLTYPDANRTLRLTFGQVEPLHPHDAVEYGYVTTLTGVMEKETGVEPFIVPPKLKELWEKKDFGTYADPVLKDVPVDFIADLDITGGNSGSPVINGKGELIGCAFDGNWDSVVADYIFEDRYDRTISVDARYILFVLDKFSGAENILKELVIH